MLSITLEATSCSLLLVPLFSVSSVFVEALSAGSLLVIPWVDAAGSVLLVLSDSSIYSLVLQFFHMNRLYKNTLSHLRKEWGKVEKMGS